MFDPPMIRQKVRHTCPILTLLGSERIQGLASWRRRVTGRWWWWCSIFSPPENRGHPSSDGREAITTTTTTTTITSTTRATATTPDPCVPQVRGLFQAEGYNDWTSSVGGWGRPGMEPSRVPGGPAPRLGFLLATLALTMAATGMLCGAIMSDHWEEVSWDKEILMGLSNITAPTWYLDGQIAMLEPHPGHKHHYFHKQPAFLVPMHGGIWTLCVSLTEEEIRLLGQVGFPQEKCINYLTPDEAHEEIRATWQNRMQNLSISCSLVCLIVLSCAALVGFFGLCRHQISAVLVTGVMYLLAATFALFTLTIIHFKRAQDRGGARVLDGPEDGVIGGPVPKSVLKARKFITSWSLDFGWGGVTLCALASVAWILLSKIMRFSPIAALIA